MRADDGVKRAIAKRIVAGTDERFHLSGALRKESSHVFPKHDSFFWGELALYSFVVLVLSGTFLALFFTPDTTEVFYHGSYQNAQGLHMSRAYQSALDLSFAVRGGLFIRQVHHWAALVFVASIVLHMFRNFFTGAFRRPREFTWVTGVVLLMVGLVEGYLVTRCLTTCSPGWACGSSPGSCCPSRWSARGRIGSRSVASSRATCGSPGSSSATCSCCLES
jgi:ubiquinol-cytochrome c reductase cytochrome b subunit